MINKKIEKVATDLLMSVGVKELPVPVEKVAQLRGLQVRPYDLGEDVSGMLVIDAGNGTIGFNPLDSKVRQRFTIAHELGHYELHKTDTGVFIDTDFRVEFRNERSSSGEDKKEREANAFAAALLMPQKLLIKEIANHDYDLTEEDSMRDLAKIFHVSVLAMTYRLANLNYFKY